MEVSLCIKYSVAKTRCSCNGWLIYYLLAQTFSKLLRMALCKLSKVSDSFQSQGREELLPFWNAFNHLFSILKKQNRSEKSARIDEALNLLYLASGVFYHRIKEISSATLETDPRLTGVEDIPTLLKICKWTGATTASEMENEIIEKMNTVAKRLS